MNFVSYALVQKQDVELGCNIVFGFFFHTIFKLWNMKAKKCLSSTKYFWLKTHNFFSLLIFFLSRKYSEEIYVESLRLCKVEISWAH